MSRNGSDIPGLSKPGVGPVSKPKVIIYTDGSCWPNPGPGGWCAVVMKKLYVKNYWLVGSEAMTTNNRMELSAAIFGLLSLKRPSRVTIWSDSTYVTNGSRTLIQNSALPGWKGKMPRKNPDLWEQLLDAAKPHSVTWQWVRGHSGDHYNELCDRLAEKARVRQL